LLERLSASFAPPPNGFLRHTRLREVMSQKLRFDRFPTIPQRFADATVLTPAPQ
jgi:hypothetical protein